MAINGGIVLSKEMQIILTPCTQLCNVGKATEEGAIVMTISKETEFEFNSGLIVTDAKRRRTAFRPHDKLRLDVSNISNLVEVIGDLKNRLAVGPIHQAHREQ